MYTYTDIGRLGFELIPTVAGGMPGCYRWWLRGPGDRGAGDGVLGQRLVGGQVVEEHLRLRDVPLHYRARARVAEPAERHHGRHRVFQGECHRGELRQAGAPVDREGGRGTVGRGITANGLMSVPVDVILDSSDFRRARWSCSRCRSRPRGPRIRGGPPSPGQLRAGGWSGHAAPERHALRRLVGRAPGILAWRKARLRLPALLVAVPPVRPFFAHRSPRTGGTHGVRHEPDRHRRDVPP